MIKLYCFVSVRIVFFNQHSAKKKKIKVEIIRCTFLCAAIYFTSEFLNYSTTKDFIFLIFFYNKKMVCSHIDNCFTVSFLHPLGLRGAIPYALSLHLGLEPIEKRQLIGTTTIIIVLFTILLMGGGTMPLIRIMDIEESQSRRKNKKDINLSKTEKMVMDKSLWFYLDLHTRTHTVCWLQILGVPSSSAVRFSLFSSERKTSKGWLWVAWRTLDEQRATYSHHTLNSTNNP